VWRGESRARSVLGCLPPPVGRQAFQVRGRDFGASAPGTQHKQDLTMNRTKYLALCTLTIGCVFGLGTCISSLLFDIAPFLL